MLKERSARILSVLMDLYLKEGEPVGSRTLSKAGLAVSPATIRNEMADLEDAGFLEQPHTSAGRVPTDKAYRYWLDRQQLECLSAVEEDEQALKSLDSRYLRASRGLENLLSNTTKILSEVCELAGVASLPNLTGTPTRIELVGLDRNHVMAILVSESGLASSHTLTVSHSLRQEDLNKISRVFNEEGSRSSVRGLVGNRLETIRQLEREAREVAQRVLRRLEEALVQAETEVFYDGLSRLLSKPHGREERPKKLVLSLASGDFLAPLLRRGSGEGTQVRIGSETELVGLEDYALVAAGYASSNGGGTIGILGPKRMDYRRVVGVVNDMKRRLDEILA